MPLKCRPSAAVVPTRADTGGACLTIDVEEYFHCEAFAARVRPESWPSYPPRAGPCLERLAELVESYGSRATLFVLGCMAPGLGPLLRELAGRGHEIACHGDAHEHLSRLTPAGFRADLRRALGRIEDAVGLTPRGFRAPTFSITRATAWALDVLAEEGLDYDASIFPVLHDRYGVAGAPGEPFWAVGPAGGRILEFPPLTINAGITRVPVGGGGYLRLLPVALVRQALARRIAQGRPALLYVHPWELDPDQPRLPAGRFAQWRHRVNLHATARKLESLLLEFHFETVGAVLERLRGDPTLPAFHLQGDALRGCSR